MARTVRRGPAQTAMLWAATGGTFPLAIGVLQVLALDIGTDMLPALALGGEPPRPGLLDRPPNRGHLIDRHVLRRAFGLLGPTEALVEMAAFVAVLAAAGWTPGSIPSTDTVLVASGAAFTTVVLGQLATAIACRSSTRTVAEVGLRGNRLLVGAILIELSALALFLMWRPLADLLEHDIPTALGLCVALLAIPAVILVDTADKRWIAHRKRRRQADSPEATTHPYHSSYTTQSIVTFVPGRSSGRDVRSTRMERSRNP